MLGTTATFTEVAEIVALIVVVDAKVNVLDEFVTVLVEADVENDVDLETSVRLKLPPYVSA